MDIAICALLFFSSVVFCLLRGYSLVWALTAALAALWCTGLRRGISCKALWGMAETNVPKSLIVVRILCLIGLLTGLWRSGGTIALFIEYGIRMISPRWFLMLVFLLTAVVSYAIGTSFGVASTIGVVLMALARAGGVSEAMTAGVVMSGIYFGDRGAPTSSCASLVAALTETDLYGNVKKKLKTVALPMALTLGIYALLSRANPIQTVDEGLLALLEENFGSSVWLAVPALIMVVLPLLKVSIRRAIAVSILAALVLTVFVQHTAFPEALRIALLGYHPESAEVEQVMSGGGFVSMLPTMLMNVFAAACTGILEGLGVLKNLKGRLSAMRERVGLLPATCLAGTAIIMVVCNQTIALVMTNQLLGEVYAREEKEHEEFAMDMANSVVTIAGLVPWSIACSVPLSMLDVGVEALPYASLLYLIPLCYLFTKKFFYQSSNKRNEAKP